MPQVIMSVDHPGWLQQAKRVLDKGDLLAFPTDTVYGIAASVRDPQAIQRLFEAKKRPQDKSIPVLISSLDQLPQVAIHISEAAKKIMEHFWPGALTLVLERHNDLPRALGLEKTIGVRMPDHPVALSLMQHVGPLAVTSANLSGEREARTAEEVVRQLADQVQLVLDGGESPGGRPSTVIQVSENRVQILREGSISLEEIDRVMDRSKGSD